PLPAPKHSREWGGISHTRRFGGFKPMTIGVEKELAGLGKQNGATIGRLHANGNLGRAEEGPDRRMHARRRIPPDGLARDAPRPGAAAPAVGRRRGPGTTAERSRR